MTVHFIGAGPGAADLITVRGRDLIARCPVCLYAGSIVPRDLLAHCPPGARIVDTAPLSLDEIETEFVKAAKARGARAMGGAGMCVHQAVDAFRHFSGKTPDIDRMKRTFAAAAARRSEGGLA